VADSPTRDVSLTVPAQAGYLVLARLALSAVCRLTPLEAVEVADLKLAVSEAATEFLHDGDPTDDTIDFDFRLAEHELVLELSGPTVPINEAEQELSRAIIEATVDRSEFAPGRVTLVKRLG
jgi:anti-sigma regulatory factor (Ser/Thr protein kinase)